MQYIVAFLARPNIKLPNGTEKEYRAQNVNLRQLFFLCFKICIHSFSLCLVPVVVVWEDDTDGIVDKARHSQLSWATLTVDQGWGTFFRPMVILILRTSFVSRTNYLLQSFTKVC